MTVERCIDSVKRQTVPTDHILVADGVPQEWIEEAGVRHIRLDRNHGDYGQTPRGIGCMIAAAERYGGIGLLDADCWLEVDHVETCLRTASAAAKRCDYVLAHITLRRPDGSAMNLATESHDTHVDTNAFFFLEGSFHKLAIWALLPKQASAVGDRLFWLAMKGAGLVGATTSKATVNYTSLWAASYRALGEQPPPDAKPNPDHRGIQAWISSLSDEDLALQNRIAQVDLEALYPWNKRSRGA